MLNNNKLPIVLICTQVLDNLISDKAVADINNTYKQIIIDNPCLFFIVKIHPRQNKDFYNDLFKDITVDNFAVVKEWDIYRLFRVSDVQISVGSYSSFEALVFGVPVIIFRGHLLDYFNHFDDRVFLKASNIDELNNQICKCFADGFHKNFIELRDCYLRDKLGFIDGVCGGRVVNIIENIIGG